MHEISRRKGKYTRTKLHIKILISWQKDVDLSHFHISIHAVTSRLSTTSKCQLSSNVVLNFYHIRIATILGKLSDKRQEQDQESSPKQLYRSEYVTKTVSTRTREKPSVARAARVNARVARVPLARYDAPHLAFYYVFL